MMDKKDIMYQVSFDEYNYALKQKDTKKIFINDKFVALSVGISLCCDNEFKSALCIEAYYGSDDIRDVTETIPQLENWGDIVALNPKFKDKKLIEKLKELKIISDTGETVKYNNKTYELVKVDIDELSLYAKSSKTTIDEYKKTYNAVKNKEKSIE